MPRWDSAAADELWLQGYIALQMVGGAALAAALARGIPLRVAMDVAKAEEAETQRGHLKAYVSEQLKQNSIQTTERTISERRYILRDWD